MVHFLSDSMTWEEEPLDLGSNARQVLLKDKSNEELAQPVEQPQRLIVRTGECSGQFVLQAYQKLQIEQYGYSIEEV